MRRLLDRHLTEQGDGVVEKGVGIDPSIADRLRAMGYLRSLWDPHLVSCPSDSFAKSLDLFED
ncbi:MAG: hypothetical protein OEM05_15370 [Myxococcales bacterium]|nr:hypothetical protein [Myxococcales bacterium]